MTLEVASDALLAEARSSAQRILAEGDAEARELIAAARREAGEITARARAQGEAEGRLLDAREAARRAADARARVLAARGADYQELRRRVGASVLGLRGEPGYPALLERLAVAARRELGDAAVLEVDPPEVGGVRARAGTRLLDYTLPSLAVGCLEALGPRLRRLWE